MKIGAIAAAKEEIDAAYEAFGVGDGFASGFNQLRVGDRSAALNDLKAVLECRNKWVYYRYKSGVKKCTPRQAAAVEAVLRKYGVTNNIWGK